ncbi:MAG: type II toxin-antitoxin system HicA family toxin [Bacteroidota bacterium]
MSKLPLVDAKTLEKVLLLLGFEIKRQKGSHIFYRHPDGRYATIPHHKGRDLGRSLLRAILRQVEITQEEFIELLGQV